MDYDGHGSYGFAARPWPHGFGGTGIRYNSDYTARSCRCTSNQEPVGST